MVHKEAGHEFNHPAQPRGFPSCAAQAKGPQGRKSLNRTIQELLTESVGLKGKVGENGKKKDVYEELCGAMSYEELKKMEEAEKEFDAVEEKDWK